MSCGFHAGRVDCTRDISHGSKSKSHGSNISGYICTSVGWLVLDPLTFPRMSCSLFFLPALFAALLCGVRANKEKETATHAWAISHARSARPWVHRLAASPQLGRWICQQGLRSARIPGLLLVLAAASAAAAASSTTTAFAFLRLVTFRAGMAVLSLLLLRLQPARDSRHTIGLVTSSSGYCLVIFLLAVMTYDQRIGTREAGSGKFCIIYGSAAAGRLHGNGPQL